MPTIAFPDEKQEDFIAQLLRYIDEGQPERSISRLQDIENLGDRFETLYSLFVAAQDNANHPKLRLDLGTLRSIWMIQSDALARSLDYDLVIQGFELVVQVIVNLYGLVPISQQLSDEIQKHYQDRLARIYDEIQYLKQQEAKPVLDVIAEVIWDEMCNLSHFHYS